MGKAFAYMGNETVGSVVEERLAAIGYARVDDVGSASTVLTYCTSQTALEDAYFDEDGLVQAARKGTLLIDLSPSTPSFARELNAVAVVSDLAAVEAPLVVADIARADAFDKGNLVCLAAGDEQALESARPVLEAVAGEVRDTGGAGSAQLARAAYTLQATAQVASAVEADALYRAVRRSSSSPYGQGDERVGAATPTAERVLDAVDGGRFDGAYTVEMFMAELSAALTAADDVDLILPQAEACLHLLELLAVIGGSDKAPAALALVYGEEGACAEQGLDWTRAEEAYGEADDGFDDYDFGDGDDGCGHDHGGYPDYPGYGAYSAN